MRELCCAVVCFRRMDPPSPASRDRPRVPGCAHGAACAAAKPNRRRLNCCQSCRSEHLCPSRAVGGPPLAARPSVPLSWGRAAGAPGGHCQAPATKTVCPCSVCPSASARSHTQTHERRLPKRTPSLGRGLSDLEHELTQRTWHFFCHSPQDTEGGDRLVPLCFCTAPVGMSRFLGGKCFPRPRRQPPQRSCSGPSGGTDQSRDSWSARRPQGPPT